jgi:hypothetical protein
MCKPKCDKSIVYAFSIVDGTLLRQSSEIDGLVFISDLSPDGRLALLFGYQTDRFDSKPSLYILNLDDLTVTDLSELVELPVPQGIWHGTIQWLPIVNP